MTDSPTDWRQHHDARLEAMIRIGIDAGAHTLKYFRDQNLTVDAKSDQSPVTVADREAEQLVRRRIAEQFPDDAVVGEEFPDAAGTSGYRWTVDPIDGTKSFVCGVPLYSTLLALEQGDSILGGMIFVPAAGEVVVAAIGHGCWYSDQFDRARTDAPLPWVRCSVSEKSDLQEAVFVTSQVDTFDVINSTGAYRRLQDHAWLTRTWGDGYGYLMVATGRAEIMVDPLCNVWDVAAIPPILREAGGRFTDWKGNETASGGNGVGTNGRLHDATLAILRAG